MTEVDAVRSAAALDHLDRLVSIPSLPARSNLEILDYATAVLAEAGVESQCSFHDDGERGNLIAVIGPQLPGGVMLNGHTDVVPVDGQTWTSDPFKLRVEHGNAYGRGAVDMKGFLACLLAMAPRFAAAELKRPVIYALTFDEEIGGEGAALLAKKLADDPLKPGRCIVGEPTELAIVGACKGGVELRTEIRGVASHARDPRNGANALYAAARFVAEIETIAERYAAAPVVGSPFDPAFTTLNAGLLVGGSSRNTVADHCAIDWEIRPIAPEDGPAILAEMDAKVRDLILPKLRAWYPRAEIETRVVANVPPLEPPTEDDAALSLARGVTGRDKVECVSFGTDAGYFQGVGIPTVVCGPGSIETAHQPDEHIRVDDLAAGIGMLDRVAAKLEA